jgi:hypothetical protein
MTIRIRIPALAAAAATAAVLWTTAAAGPPTICHPVAIGDARSLPWSGNGRTSDYAPKTVVADTLRILDEESSPLVHMETLRRATVYIDRNRERALELLCGIMAAALDGDAAGTPDALAWFDAGYLVQCFQQNGLDLNVAGGAARGVAGYGWVRKAMALRPDEAELEFGAAILTMMAGIPEHQAHRDRARALAKDGTLLAENLRSSGLAQARRENRG